ncbi:MAG: amidohydrolase, partial [Actinomycetes bacterium]
MSTLYLGGALFRTGVGSLPGWGLRVSGERIEAVLPDDVLLADRVSGDEVVDVRGGLISPGFIDAHYHPTIGGLDLNACDLTPATNA